VASAEPRDSRRAARCCPKDHELEAAEPDEGADSQNGEDRSIVPSEDEIVDLTNDLTLSLTDLSSRALAR
jgi:hypothetical protein